MKGDSSIVPNIYNFKKKFDGCVLETIGELDLYIGVFGKIVYILKKITHIKRTKQ